MSAKKAAAGTLTPWMWPTAEIIARCEAEAVGSDIDGRMSDAMTRSVVALQEALQLGVPADGREAAILALALLPITYELNVCLIGTDDYEHTSKLVETLRDGLERVALRIAPTDLEERKIFDAMHAGTGGEQEGPTVLRFDYTTGAAVIAGGQAPAAGAEGGKS